MLTCQMLIRNDMQTIQRAIDSLSTINAEIIIADIGSTDGCADLCRELGFQVFNTQDLQHLGKLRNRLISVANHDWHMVLEPWEVVTEPANIEQAVSGEPDAYFMPILKNNTISYEVRLWHRSLNLSFVNPVYEYLDIKDDNAAMLEGMLYSDGERLTPLAVLNQWRENNPSDIEPIYYLAFHHLAEQAWDKFLGYASKYLFTERLAKTSALMIKYYASVVLCHVKCDVTQSLKHILECIAVRPLMAEYWCLLGDIYYHRLGDYDKAKRFYQNAIILGSQRKEHDKSPIEIPKYREYPEKMIASCEMLKKGKRQIVNYSSVAK